MDLQTVDAVAVWIYMFIQSQHLVLNMAAFKMTKKHFGF